MYVYGLFVTMLCEVGVPVVGESLEVDDQNIGELPEIKLLGGLHKVLALWTVPSEQTQLTSRLYWQHLCVCANHASSFPRVSFSVKRRMQSMRWMDLLLSSSTLL